jgi:hypothetical protein
MKKGDAPLQRLRAHVLVCHLCLGEAHSLERACAAAACLAPIGSITIHSKTAQCKLCVAGPMRSTSAERRRKRCEQ